MAAASTLLAACGAPAASPTAAPKAAEPTKPAAAAPAATTAPAAKPAEPTKPAAGAAPTAIPTVASKPASKPGGVKVTMHMRAGGEKSEPAIYVERPDEWAAETGNTYELLPIPAGKEYLPKIMARAAGNTIGDTLFTGDSYSEHTFMVRNDLIEPDDDYFSRNNIKKTEWITAIIDTLTHNGKMYGLPKASNPADSFMNVNLKMFDDAGIKRPETYGTTFDQVRDWAIQFSKGPKDRREVYGYYSGLNSNQTITNGVRQFGGDIVDKDGVTSLVDQEPFWNWLQWNHNLVVKEAVHPQGSVVPAGDSNQLAAMFAAGKLAMMHSHRAWQRAIKTAVGSKFEQAVIQFPRGPQPKGWVSNVDTHSVTKASKLKDQAFSLMYAMADRRFAYLVAKGQGYLTGRVDNLEAIKELADDPFIKVQAKNDTQQERWWRAKNLRAYEVEAELVNILAPVWLGKREPDKALIAELKKGIDAVLAKPDM
ncbi:MAG: extracellular solute-binding protein [Chloroflexi bacterium]|nr:extracellular solute-binding protein [Chloroflexota bacterium]